jgi:tRNA threonylcarbamoyladenosine biosynthesis protein TsaE
MLLSLDSHSPDETRRFGLALGRLLRPGDAVLLEGQLGAGKTTLVRAIAAGMGLDERAVSSPTFVTINEYASPGGLTLVHVDAYRLAGEDDLDSLGWDRALEGDRVLVVEWPERIAAALPAGAATVRLTHAGERSRRLEVELPDSWTSRQGVGSLAAEGPGEGTGPGEEAGTTGTADRSGAGRRATTCPITGRPVPADSPTWPFADERARLADLYRWFSGQHALSRPVELDEDEPGD